MADPRTARNCGRLSKQCALRPEGCMNMRNHVEFRGRLVADHYPERHARAQSTPVYDGFADGVRRNRVRYGAQNDRYPDGITYASRDARRAFRLEEFRKALAINNHHVLKITYTIYEPGTPAQIEERIAAKVAQEVIRTDHRCPDCAVNVGEFHLPGCDVEVCPKCNGQSISCDCSDSEAESDKDAENPS